MLERGQYSGGRRGRGRRCEMRSAAGGRNSLLEGGGLVGAPDTLREDEEERVEDDGAGLQWCQPYPRTTHGCHYILPLTYSQT